MGLLISHFLMLHDCFWLFPDLQSCKYMCYYAMLLKVEFVGSAKLAWPFPKEEQSPDRCQVPSLFKCGTNMHFNKHTSTFTVIYVSWRTPIITLLANSYHHAPSELLSSCKRSSFNFTHDPWLISSLRTVHDNN